MESGKSSKENHFTNLKLPRRLGYISKMITYINDSACYDKKQAMFYHSMRYRCCKKHFIESGLSEPSDSSPWQILGLIDTAVNSTEAGGYGRAIVNFYLRCDGDQLKKGGYHQ